MTFVIKNLKPKEETLSDKMWCEESPRKEDGLIPVKDVKESIKRLKALTGKGSWHYEINKIFGDKLT